MSMHQKFLLAVLCSLSLLLDGCGGGGSATTTSSATGQSGPVDGSTVSSLSSIDVTIPAQSSSAASAIVIPKVVAFSDSSAPGTSGSQANFIVAATGLKAVDTTPITVGGMPMIGDPGLTAAASASAPSSRITYTPSQIRLAYQLPPLPSSWSGLAAATAAQMGAGQTIYLVDAMDDPRIGAELDAFSAFFGLPTCTHVAITPSTPLPLAAAAAGCQFSVVYTDSNANMTAVAPASGWNAAGASWATEIAMDVEWAHATAPLARLILIEAPDSSITSMLGAINLANSMGPGVVSMSFGTTEKSWTSLTDASFTVSGMSYVAAAGDDGSGVEWPAVSPYVLGVGGTHLSYVNGQRAESAWSSTGGGIS